MATGRRRGLILQHGKDAPPAILGEWARSRRIEHEVHRRWEDSLPADWDVEALFGKEALLHGDPPGTVMGVAVALYTDRAGHGTPEGIEPRSNDVMP